MTPRRAAQVDENQADLVTALRRIGASVTSTASAGAGFPDICVGWQGRNFLMEVKNPDKDPNQRKLTPAQKRWHAAWSGQVATVETFADCLAVLGVDVPY